MGEPSVLAVSLISGLLWSFGFAPTGIWLLVLVCSAGFYLALTNAPTRMAAMRGGLVFGVAQQLSAHYWMYGAMQTKVGMSSAAALVCLLALALYLGCFAAIAAGAYYTLRSVRWGRAAALDAGVFASVLTLSEWLRAQAYGGFSSISAGYAFADTGLRAYFPVGGVWCTSFVVFLMAALFVHAAAPASGHAQRVKAIVGVCLLWIVALSVSNIQWTHNIGRALSFRLLQANVSTDQKFDPAHLAAEIDLYSRLLTAHPADLIVTPETALPAVLSELPQDFLQLLQRFSSESGSNLLVGAPEVADHGRVYNSMVQFAPSQSEFNSYRKIRLMPFGEFTPVGLGWLTDEVDIPLKNQSAGPEGQRPFNVAGMLVGTLICQEDMMGSDARRWGGQVGVYINPTNLAWFDGTTAIEQRLQIVRVRAMELQRPILRVSNTGVTAYITQSGAIAGMLPVRQEGVLVGRVHPTAGMTPYATYGEGPLLIFSCAIVVISCFNLFQLRSSGPPRRGGRLGESST